MRRPTRKQVAFALICAVVISLELYLVFVDRDGVFTIEGREVYDLTEFGSGAVVSHAFLMRGDGLNSVAVRFGSDSLVRVRVHWTLWRGYALRPDPMTRAFEGSDLVDLRPGHQWRTFSFTRDASSRDRWYTVEFRLTAIERSAASEATAALPQVTLSASRDNPERGGLLWLNGAHLPGSLLIRAGRQGRTIYRRFVAEVEPNLPAPLRNPAVQWGAVLAFHWAFLVFAWAVISDSARGPTPTTLP